MRGEIENRIKELHHALEIDRTSCTDFWANLLRVLIAADAYVLMQELRLAAARTICARAQVSTLRDRLLKLAAPGSRLPLAASCCTCRTARRSATSGSALPVRSAPRPRSWPSFDNAKPCRGLRSFACQRNSPKSPLICHKLSAPGFFGCPIASAALNRRSTRVRQDQTLTFRHYSCHSDV